MDKPIIKHKYITLFGSEAEFNASYPSFEEVNWSDVGFPPERPDEYRISRRLSNMYHKNVPPDYKFDNVNDTVSETRQIIKKNEEGEWEIGTKTITIKPDANYIATYRSQDWDDQDIRETFFLEIIWGYNGWEWNNYTRIIGKNEETGEDITETLKGGNLYKIKEITTVPGIIDGNRLQHINDFLNSQNKVLYVEGFNTSNLVAANRAFKRISTPTRRSSSIPSLYLIDQYDSNGNLKEHYFGYENNLIKLEEADQLFYNNKLYVLDNDNGNAINIPNITHINNMYSYGYLTDNLKFNFPKLESLSYAFKLAIIPRSIINVNEIFIGDSLKNAKDLSYMFMGASLTGYETTEEGNVTKVILDLTNSEVSQDEVINLGRFLGWVGPREYQVSGTNDIIANTILDVDLNFKNKVNLNAAFGDIIRNKNTQVSGLNEFNQYLRNGGFSKIRLNLHNKESLISSIVGGFYSTKFIEPNPIQQVPNNECNDRYIYRYCTFNMPTLYDFKNGELESPRIDGYGQFDNCTFNDTVEFRNVNALDRVEFTNISFGKNVSEEDRKFPHILQDQENPVYRYVDFYNSKFNFIPGQNIYVDTKRYFLDAGRMHPDSNLNIFSNCSELTDLSDIHIYYTDADSNVSWPFAKNYSIHFNFTGNTKMTKTPHIHFFHRRNGKNGAENSYLYSNRKFENLKNLTEINFEYYYNESSSAGACGFTCQNCTNLVYLRISTAIERGYFTAALNIRNCPSLDIPTLEQTLLKFRSGSLYCLQSTWDQLSTEVQNYCISKVTVQVLDDNEYDENNEES